MIDRKTHCSIHINARCEIGVASTKAYTSQIVDMAMMTLAIGADRISTQARRQSIVDHLSNLPISEVLKLDGEMRDLAESLIDSLSLCLEEDRTMRLIWKAPNQISSSLMFMQQHVPERRDSLAKSWRSMANPLSGQWRQVSHMWNMTMQSDLQQRLSHEFDRPSRLRNWHLEVSILLQHTKRNFSHLQSSITPLFEKMLSASDAGQIGRLVLPKKCAEVFLRSARLKAKGGNVKVSDELDTLPNIAILVYNDNCQSSQPQTRHPHHKPNKSSGDGFKKDL
ncbi:hypothetical protein ZIOFF_066517 [Zingiber officinale]|uniref:Uncharacterized protein n=1 Tax=Zingiber officinale TaxID=94328 RepID=A0A8J5EYF2_ZINOF|nr:hypothetical protein ZIOFF_066517 [Zingiber officinale]